MAKPFPASDAKSWAIMNAGSLNVDVANHRVALLEPAVDFGGPTWGSVAWARDRQCLILFQGPPNGGADGDPASYTIHVVTIPTGITNGTPNWKTQPWVVEQPELALGPNTTRIHAGVAAAGYKRFSWSDRLDCAIWVGAPESSPVQAIRLW
jgi:hypothetical protein